jgi:hypothetical protein
MAGSVDRVRKLAILRAVLATFAGAFVFSSPSWAKASPRWSLALPEGDGGVSLEAQRPLIERGLRVEMQDAVVQGRGEEPPDQVFLLVAVTRGKGGLSVQVWDRGENAGTRVVSAAGPPPVVARRIALAVSELGRELSRRRGVLVKRQQAEKALALEQAALVARQAERERPRLNARAVALFLPDHGYLVGPSLGLSFNGDFPYRVGLALGYLQGQLTELGPSGSGPAWLAWDVRLSVERWFLLDPRWAVSAGLDLRALLIRGTDGVTFDHTPGQVDSYCLLGGFRSAVSFDLGSGIAGTWAVDGGPILRSFAVEQASKNDLVRGFYLGVSLGVDVAWP